MSVLRPEFYVREDIETGAPGPVAMEKVKLFNRTSDYHEKSKLGDWLKEYNEGLDWNDYDHAICLTGRLATISKRLRMKPSEDEGAGGS